MNLISLHLSPKMNLFKGILSIQKKDVSQKEQQLLSEKMDILMEIKSKDQEINSLKERLYSLESQVEKSKIKIREQSSKLNVALADLKEANIQLNELKESGLDKDAKLDSLHKEIEDLEEKMRAQSVKYEEELQVFEANRKKDEKKELEKYNELQGEIERLMMDKQDASFCVDESERKAKSLETEVKKIKLENDELSERYKRKEMELESKISILKEDSNKVIYNKESIILEIQDDLRRIQSQKDALEREKTTMERSLYKKEEVQKSQMREIESLKLKVERQKEEINAKPPCSPVKVINNIVVDKTSELEDEKKALSYEKKMFEAEKREIISQKEEMKKIKLS
nr:paramyosin-like [Lepeophtheirus salmonis]